MDIDTRKLAFTLASKSCEVLAVNVTAEKLWSLVEAFIPILEGGLTELAPDGAYICGKCGRMSRTTNCENCGHVYQRPAGKANRWADP